MFLRRSHIIRSRIWRTCSYHWNSGLDYTGTCKSLSSAGPYQYLGCGSDLSRLKLLTYFFPFFLSFLVPKPSDLPYAGPGCSICSFVRNLSDGAIQIWTRIWVPNVRFVEYCWIRSVNLELSGSQKQQLLMCKCSMCNSSHFSVITARVILLYAQEHLKRAEHMAIWTTGLCTRSTTGGGGGAGVLSYENDGDVRRKFLKTTLKGMALCKPKSLSV